jgi:chemotaxis protein methyltransferase CheR
MDVAEAGTTELARAVGLELGAYRQEHVHERIRRAIEREHVRDVRALASLVARDPDARARFRRSVAVSVSGLFRDAAQFDLLERKLLPDLLVSGRRISVWSAGCADGSELYSVAVLLRRLGALDRALLLGSDLLEENLELARAGAYDGVSFEPELRARLRWERRDLVREGAADGRWRLILCRNLAIYLDASSKRALHAALAGALAVDGVLMLGRSERIDDPSALALERVHPHVYRRPR